MKTDDFDFHLPEDLIALRPARPRPSSRMLVAEGDGIVDSVFSRIGEYLKPGDLLVLNDTKVIPGRLTGRRDRPDGASAEVEVTLIAPLTDGGWRALARPAKRLRAGDVIVFSPNLSAEVSDRDGGEVSLHFPSTGNLLLDQIEEKGEMPLPPYIARRRPVDALDLDDYQTVFARTRGAVAAPTASLHFTTELLQALAGMGVEMAWVTLHVGAGTFLPVKVDDVENHRMHSEWASVGQDTVEAVRRTRERGGRVVAVGTTALRALETAAAGKDEFGVWEGDTDIFIRPGFQFRIVDGLITNFHLPKSTLLMLVSALMGTDCMRKIYAHAIEQRYRFYSYGDSSLLLPHR